MVRIRSPKQESIFSDLEELQTHLSTDKKANEPVLSPGAVPDKGKSPDENVDEPLSDISLAVKRLGALSLLNFEFVFVSAQTLMMGSPVVEPGRNADELRHEVILSKGFYLQATLVTQAQWTSVMGYNPSAFSNEAEALPVENISWHECQEFINILNRSERFTYRLATEAEWECACRAGSMTPFACGEITELYCGLDPRLDRFAWYCGNSARKTHPVASKAPNALGLYDMHGNLSEWCQDWYGEYMDERQVEPVGPNGGPGRVVRGGSWFSNAKNCRSASRFYWPPNSKSDFIGFRLVREESAKNICSQ